MTYQEIIDDIKSLKIQGAEKIAIAAVEAFALKLAETQTFEVDPTQAANRATILQQAYQELAATRATEPALRNALKYCLQNYQQNPNVTDYVINYFKQSKQKIAEFGAKKIKDGMVVFTHCHSSTVEDICAQALKEGKKFTVYNTETRPKFQGRLTAQNIAKLGIPVVHFVDSSARTFMKDADLFLFGCDAISSEGKIYNKIGTTMIAEFAHQNNVPTYSCTNSWKFDPETINGAEEVIEERDPKEVWPDAPAGITIKNPAFEIVNPDIVTGIITELGIFKPETLVTEVQKAYPWLVK